jgi:hypothetical protein
MTGRNGEVAIKRDGHVHAVATPELSGPITVDVGAEQVEVPPETHVSFQDQGSATSSQSVATETDGGVTTTTTSSEIELRGGLAMSKEQSAGAIVLAAISLLVAGYLHGTSDPLAAGLVVLTAGLLGWFSLNSLVRWREVEQQ